MYTVITTKQFEKSIRRLSKRGLNISLLAEAVELLRQNGTLPMNYHPHVLHGKWEGHWECHIQPDWLLIWKQNNTELTLILVDTGSHSDLF